MNIKKTVLSLPVKDLQISQNFYQQGLGLTTSGIDESIISLELPGLSLFLIEKSTYETYSFRAGIAAYFPTHASECIISAAIPTKQEVDQILTKAKASGGTILNPAKSYGPLYTGYFQDPDGHLWEIVWSP